MVTTEELIANEGRDHKSSPEVFEAVEALTKEDCSSQSSEERLGRDDERHL